MAYTREQLLTGAEKAKQAGDMASAQELLSMADSMQPETKETEGLNLDKLRKGIEAAIKDGNYEAAKELSDLAKITYEAPSGPDVSGTDAAINAAKVGFTQSASFATGILNALVPNFEERMKGPMTPASLISAMVSAGRGDVKGKTPGAVERFKQGQTETEKIVTELTGADPNMPLPRGAGIAEKLLYSGIREGSDVTNYLGAFTFKLGKIIPEFLGRGAQSFGFGATSELGAEVGEDVEQTFFGTDTGVGRVVGALKGGLGSVAITPALKKTVGATVDVGGQVWNKYKAVKNNPQQAADEYATGAAKNLLEIAKEGLNPDTIEQTIKDFNRIAGIIGRDNFPLLVSMADNPALRSQTVRLAKKDATFRQKVKEELTSLSLAIDARAKDLFGPRYAVANLSVSPAVKEIQLKRQERLQNIDEKLEELSFRYVPTSSKADVGFAIKNLVDAKKKIAKKELSQNYEALMQEAKKNGIRMPKGAVRDVYNFIRQNQIRDIFGKGTALDKQILKHWSPKESLANDFAPASFEQVESLKRAINKEIGKSAQGSDTQRKLYQLLEVFEQARTQIKGNYSQRLADIDKLYYERVGINFTAQGIKDMDSKKYAEKVAPVILENKEALDDFLRVAGEQGNEIAKNAMYMKIYKDAFDANGLIDRRKLLTFKKRNQEIIDTIPGMNEEVIATLADERVLQLRKAGLDQAIKAQETKIAKNIFLKNKDIGTDYNKEVKKMINNSDNIQPFFDALSDLSPEGKNIVLNAARREFIEIGRREGTSMYDFVVDPSNRAVVNKLFGAGHVENVKDLAKLSDALAKANIDDLSAIVAKEELDFLNRLLPGLDVPYVTAQVRDRISSTTQKLVRLASRFQVAKGREAVDDAISDLLLDPKGMQKVHNAVVTFDFKLNKPESLKNITGAYADVLPLYFYTSTKTGLSPQDE